MKKTILATLVAAAALTTTPAQAAAGTTLQNLQAAYDGESNASARYAAFAAKADTEGFLSVGRLFRAASRAETIHATAHAKVIQALGAKPRSEVGQPVVKSTRENLQAAIAGETYEKDTMYPEFLAVARKDGNADAIRTLNLARNAEIEHARLYQAAVDGLEGQRAAGAPFYVCAVCGFTTRTLPAEKCPSSFSPKEKFERID
jgi:rubrerythrin